MRASCVKAGASWRGAGRGGARAHPGAEPVLMQQPRALRPQSAGYVHPAALVTSPRTVLMTPPPHCGRGRRGGEGAMVGAVRVLWWDWRGLERFS